MMPGTMFATFIESPHPRVTDTVEPGDLVLVQIPHNCAVYATSPVEARYIAQSWFEAGIRACDREPGPVSDLMFDRMWDEHGIVLGNTKPGDTEGETSEPGDDL